MLTHSMLRNIRSLNLLQMYIKLKVGFAQQKSINLLKQLRQQQVNNRISHPSNYSSLLSLIKQDTLPQNSSQFQLYTHIQPLFISYVDELNKSYDPSTPSNNNQKQQYDPYNIIRQQKQLIQLLKVLSLYPSLINKQSNEQQQQFRYSKQTLRKMYRIVSKFLHARSQQQLNTILIFMLKNDNNVEESVIFGEYLKYYLRDSIEYNRAKYQLDFKNGTLWQSIKKISASLVHRGFLRRTPDYDRPLSITFPFDTITNLLANPSTKQSILTVTVMRRQIMKQIAHIFEHDCHSNLYHTKNTDLWSILNKITSVVFPVQCPIQIIQTQQKYLIQLYLKLYLVLHQQGKTDQLINEFGNICAAYSCVTNINQNINKENQSKSQLIQMYTQAVRQFVNKQMQISNSDMLIMNVQISDNMFIIMKQFPQLKPQIMQKLHQKITPITLYAYFNKIIQLLSDWPHQLFQKLSTPTQLQQNYFDVLSIQGLNKLVTKLQNNNKQHAKLYESIVGSVINRNYPDEIPINTYINMLQIYSKYRLINPILCHNNNNINIQTLRVFLFRYLADNKHRPNPQQLQNICQIILQLQDYANFGDQMGNYQLNIYQQLDQVFSNTSLLNLQVSQQIIDKIKTIAHKSNKNNNSNNQQNSSSKQQDAKQMAIRILNKFNKSS